jgi:hypothetical protein
MTRPTSRKFLLGVLTGLIVAAALRATRTREKWNRP